MSRPTTLRTHLRPGDLRLLHDLAVLRLAMDERMPARKRLEQQLGAGFARTLRSSLTEATRRAA